MRPRLIQFAAIAISVSIAFALVEIALRLTGSYAPLDEPVRPEQPELYVADAAIGYRLRSSLRTTTRYPRTSQEVLPMVSNSDGFRSSRELDEPDDRLRVLFLGDSVVFGLGVRQEDRVTEQIERLEPQWRVDNMGMTGWGIDLMVRAIEQHGKKARPDVVVLGVYTDDFRRLLPYYSGAGYAYPKFALQGSELITVPFKYPKSWERLRLYQAVYQTALNTKRNRYRNRYDLNEALLDRYLRNAETIGFKPVVVFFPAEGENKEDQERRAFLRDWTSRHEVAYLDLTTAIHDAGAQNLYITGNYHWNPAGHRVAAEHLREFLSHEVAAEALAERVRRTSIRP